MPASPFDGPRDRATESADVARLLRADQLWFDSQERLLFDRVRTARQKGHRPRANIIDRTLFNSHYGDLSYTLSQYFPNMDFVIALLAAMSFSGYSHKLLITFFGGWIAYVATYRATSRNKASPVGFIDSLNWAVQLFITCAMSIICLDSMFSRQRNGWPVVAILVGIFTTVVSFVLYLYRYFELDPSEPHHDDPPPAEEYKYNDSLITSWMHESRPGSCKIRLIHLHRRIPFQRLRATLETVPLEQARPYTAISYTWGKNPEKSKTIVLDGRAFHCTEATYNALYRASSWLNSELVWLDYVCIDQSNTNEKSDQVELMRHIYARAREVRVQITPVAPAAPDRGAPDTVGVGQFIRRLAWLVAEHEPSHRELFQIFQREVETFGRSRVTDMIEFFANPWFSRVWIIQEVVTGSPVSVYYDDRYINWESLSWASGIFADKEFANVLNLHPMGSLARRNALRFNNILRIKEVHQIHKLTAPYMHFDPDLAAMIRVSIPASIMPLEYLLSSCTSFEASDARDKVYAMVGLVIDRDELMYRAMVRPNYNKTTEEVLHTAAIYLAERRVIMGTLSHAGYGLHHAPSKHNLPSWVPDWTRPAICAPLHIPRSPDLEKSKYKASAGTLPFIAWSEDESRTKLVLLGTCFDKIVAIGPVNVRPSTESSSKPANNGNSTAAAEEIMRILDWHDRSLQILINQEQARILPLHTPEPLLEDTFWRTIIGDRSPTERPAPAQMKQHYKYWLQAARRVREASSAADMQTLSVAEEQARDFLSIPWIEAMDWCAAGRRVFVSAKGYVGMAPPGAENGDEIVLIQGAATPFVVRHPPGSTCPPEGLACHLPFHLVGECYMHGMMDGEIVRNYTANTGVGLVFV